MDMELLNAISEMLDKKLDERFEKNNEILRQEMKQNNDSLHQKINGLRQEMLEDHNRLFNQFSALVEEKVTKEIRLIAENHASLVRNINDRAPISDLKEVRGDLQTVSENLIKHRERIEKLESEVKALKKAN